MFSAIIVPGLELKLCKDKVKTVNDSIVTWKWQVTKH